MGSLYRTSGGREAIAQWCAAQLDTWPVPHTRSTVEIHGADTHILTAGTGRPTVLVVPGTNFNAASYLPLASALAMRCRVVLADLPGQPGLSSGDRLAKAGRLRWYGRWLTELADHTGEDSLTVIGHSLGAAIVLPSDSGRVTRQILVSPGGLMRLRVSPRVLAVSTSWALRRRAADSARLLQLMHGPTHQPRAELIEWMTLIARHVRSSADPGTAHIARTGVDRIAVVGQRDVFLPPARLATVVRQSKDRSAHRPERWPSRDRGIPRHHRRTRRPSIDPSPIKAPCGSSGVGTVVSSASGVVIQAMRLLGSRLTDDLSRRGRRKGDTACYGVRRRTREPDPAGRSG